MREDMEEPTKTDVCADKTDYNSLMSRRIRNILLICNSYDGYTLEEDGRLESRLNQEYAELNISNPPAITRARDTSEALAILSARDNFDLVITMYNVGEIDAFSFGRAVKERYPTIPVVLLANFSEKIARKIEEGDRSSIDYIFYWHGSADLILAIVKLMEDTMNAEHDIREVGVQAILLVEDSIRYYSTYLPAIYRLILQQSAESIKEALNEHQQTMRKRARPKILLATNYSDAVELYERYKHNLLGVISDVGFVVNRGDPASEEKLDAGIDLCKLIRKDNPLMPFLLQSSQKSIRSVAEDMGVGFIFKYSKTLLLQLGEYIAREFSFGDFVFKDPSTGKVIGRAKDLHELERLVADAPEDVLIHSASQNHLSKWMLSRGLFSLGSEFRAIGVDRFDSTERMRRFIVERIHDYRIMAGQGVIARFDPQTYDSSIWFARMGTGSMGGKARGLAFLNRMLQKFRLYDKYPGTRVMIPRTIVITTDYFDEFIRENGLQYVINTDISDEEILSEFTASRLPQQLIDCLRTYVRTVRGPLAIRSSSKLEDSYYQPFAGIYSTYMIPLTENEDQFLRLLGKAIKSVYASVYFASSRAYITATSNVISEEKMAVVIQEVCGTEDAGYFFPTLSGVARSENFYPIGDEKPSDGVVQLALGLGKAVVEGEQTLRFSPRYPKKILQLSTPELALRETQKVMYALDLTPEKFKTSIDDSVNLERFGISDAAGFRNMKYVASTWDMQDQRISDTVAIPGRRIITFANILKYGSFPLTDILNDMLAVSSGEMGCSVEIEFAANMDVPEGSHKIFNMLQIRPIADDVANVSLDWRDTDRSGAILYSESAIGIGAIEGVSVIIYVKQSSFDAAHTREIAAQIGELNAVLHNQGRSYILVGPGRWGSSDPWLGIPVKWNDISQSRVIVECGLQGFRIEPSQGTHFFQNLTSFGVGYMTINPFMEDGWFDEAMLNEMPADAETEYVRMVSFAEPLFVFVDGIHNKGIVKPRKEMLTPFSPNSKVSE